MKNSMLLKILAGIFLIILTIFVGAKTRNALAERDYIGKVVHDRDVITMSGTGKITTKPDLALIGLGLMSEGKTVREIQDTNTKKMNAVIASLKGLGVDEKDIQTSNYNLQPKIDWADGKQNITGYTLSQNVSVKVRDLDKVGDVIQKVTESGANQIQGVQFTIDDPTSVRDEARLKAIEEAKKKADQLAGALGLHIVKAISFSESSGYNPPMPMMYDSVASNMAVGKVAAPEIQAGQLDVSMDVSVTFEVR